MKKRAYLLAITILAAGVFLTALRHEETPMKLVNKKNGFIVVEFKQGQPLFGDRFLEAEMRESGILIPPSRVADFEDKNTIYLGDPLFQKAFAEVYVPLCTASSTYQWQE